MIKIIRLIKNRFFGSERKIKKLMNKGLIIGEKSIKTCYSPEGIDGVFPWLIEIGNNVIISTNCNILAHDASLASICGFSKLGRVIIKDNVYIGNGVTILPGVTIGENVIIGARSLVNKDLQSNGVYVGIPAKKLCSLDEFIEKHKSNIDSKKEEFPFFDKDFRYWQTASVDEKMKMKKKIKKYAYIKSRKL